MPKYIMIPKRSASASTARFTLSEVTADSRNDRLQALRVAHSVAQKEVQKYVKATKGVGLAASPTANLNPLGLAVVNVGNEKQAEQLKNEFPEHTVIADEPFNLIAPKRLTASHKTKLKSADLWHLTAIGRKKADKRTGAGVQVAVFDTGVDAGHAEFQGQRVTQGYRYTGTSSLQPVTPPTDSDGHGTHVAGLICGKTVGVAPGTEIVSVEMIPGGTGWLSNFVDSLTWAVENLESARIFNMSAGLPGYFADMAPALDDLLALGILPVIATGNEGRDRTRSPGNYKEVLSVGAAEKGPKPKTYGVAVFSSGGRLIVDNQVHIVPDLVAPGKAVYSSVMTGGYEAWDGTSMATPIVSGIAALLLEEKPTMPVLELMDTLQASCIDLQLPAERQGSGLVQVV